MNPLAAAGRLRSGERLFILLFSAILLLVFAGRCRRLRMEEPEFLDSGSEAATGMEPGELKPEP